MSSQTVRSLLASVAVFMFAAPAVGQEAPVAEPDEAVEEITITGSRIRGRNFDAPTPVQAITGELIDQRGATNVANVLNENPAFTGTLTPSSTTLNSRQSGVNAVDLRGLGPNRTLVLVNGRRVAPFDEFGNVDLNAIPSLAIGRVEVVTGGASAIYGSDAVAGVVNLIFDETLDSLKLSAQNGISSRGDARNTRLSAAFGTKFGGEKGHLLVAADYDDNRGVPRGSARGWQRRSPGLVANPANGEGEAGKTDGIPRFLIRDNAVLFLASPNGITLPGEGATSNLEFFPGGIVAPRVLGTNIGGALMTGGSGSRLADNNALYIPTERYNALAAARYDIADGVTLFAEASYARSKSRGILIDAFTFGDVVVQPDNAFLPAGIAALNEPFPLFRTFSDFPPITSISRNENLRFVGGLRGEFGQGWSYELSAQYGRTDFSNDQTFNLLPANLAAAGDAVFDRTVGRVVCRANLAGANGAPGCAPANLFGQGSLSPAAIDYITDTGTSDTRIQQTVFVGSVSGQLFEGWAGPILTSFGAEHRRESLNRTVSAQNDQELFAIVNAQPLRGKFDVTEVFGELNVPIIGGSTPLVLDGAVRYTDYSTVGGVVTWKTGLVFNPIEPLRLRGSISRDIRAPSIGETFIETILLFDNLSNPFNPDDRGTELVRTPTSGNRDLTEERATTKTGGVVLSLGGLRASVDYFDINLKGAIGTLGSQGIVDRCFAGETALCSLITFGPGQSIVEVRNQNLNLGTFRVQGVDFEARYSQRVGSGRIGLGVAASYLINKKIAPSGGAPLDVAGEVGAGSGFGTPDFKATGHVSYETDRLGAFAQLRYIGKGVYDATYGDEDLAPSENRIGAVAYLDVSARAKVAGPFGGASEVFAGVDNLLDRDPPVVPLDFIANTATNPAHYDVLGRKFYAGVRLGF